MYNIMWNCRVVTPTYAWINGYRFKTRPTVVCVKKKVVRPLGAACCSKVADRL